MNKTEKKQIKRKLQDLNKNTRFTTEELSLISNTFFENDDVLKAVRKFFLQAELEPQEQNIIDGLSQQTIALLRKQLLPEINADSPFYQNRDMWTSIKTDEKLAEDVYLDMKAQDIAIRYLEEQFERLIGNFDDNTIRLKELVFNSKKDPDEAFADLKARNTLLLHIDAYIDELRVIAINNAKIDDDDKIKKLDSNK